MVFPVACFSILYAAFEYYLITDPSFGIRPLLFSLIYRYHLLMAGLFGIVSYSIVVMNIPIRKHGLLTLVLVGTIFSVMLVIEDFAWFTLRAVAPRDEDINAGKLVIEGEWTTQFMGSTGFYSTAVPNWYFVCASCAIITSLIARTKKQNLLRRNIRLDASKDQLGSDAYSFTMVTLRHWINCLIIFLRYENRK
jgi:hypothetical protein